MRRSATWPRQATWLVLVWAAALAAVPLALLAGEQLRVLDADVFFRDPTAVAGLPYYYGWANTVGILMWGGTAGTCLALALILGREHSLSRFFASSLLLTALLALDDGLLWHEEFLPARGIPEPAVYVLYGLAALAWLVLNRAVLSQTAWQVLVGAIATLGGSVVLDFYERVFEPLPAQVLIEDGLKFVGIGLWFAFFVVSGVIAAGSTPIPAYGERMGRDAI